MQKTIVSVEGARPNFMKIAPLEREFAHYKDVNHITIHTGQHYDKEMSDVFFDQLGLSKPERNLGVGAGSHAETTGKIMIEFEKACQDLQPAMVIVVGDVNSTIAASLVARKLFIPVAHLEAGLRSFDETMPEELNRRLTDCLSNLLFVSEPAGMQNLKNEGIDMSRAHLVGDIMLETLNMFLPKITARERWEHFGVQKGAYTLVTLHRPSNVDHADSLEEIISLLESIEIPILFPVHPRTNSRLKQFGLLDKIEKVPHLKLIPPQPYLDFLSLLRGCRMIVSDSGSIQSEASFFDIPCLVYRKNSEHSIYFEEGTSTLVGTNKQHVRDLIQTILVEDYRRSTPLIKQLGTDVAKKTVRIIVDYLNNGVRTAPLGK